jgi:hypothetical protein
MAMGWPLPTLLLATAAGGAAATSPPLPPPTHLRVDGLLASASSSSSSSSSSSCALGVSVRPVFTAVVDCGTVNDTHDLPMALRFVASHHNGTVAWDSGFVAPGASSGAECGVQLTAGTSYRLRSMWQSAGGRASPLTAPADGCFTTALATEADWRGAQWVGAGHGEFATNFTISPAAVPPTCAGGHKLTGRAFLSAPGGGQLRVNGHVVGGGGAAAHDPGVAPWLDWTKAMHHHVVDVSSVLRLGVNQVTLLTGCGAWCPSQAPTWAHSGRAIRTPAGAQPMAKLLLLAHCEEEPHGAAAVASFFGGRF